MQSVKHSTSVYETCIRLPYQTLRATDANNDGVVDESKCVAAGGTAKEFAVHDADRVLDAEELETCAADKLAEALQLLGLSPSHPPRAAGELPLPGVCPRAPVPGERASISGI